MYKYEIHMHTSECSRCSWSGAREMIDRAKESGYTGIVMSDHFYGGNTAISRSLDWEEFVGAYERNFTDAYNYGKEKGMDVFFGIEEGLGFGKEALIYGISPELLRQTPQLKSFSTDELSQFVRQNGGLIVCAHPFRHRDYISNPDEEPNPQYFDAIEVYNHFNTDDENLKAKKFAEKHNLLQISGGDIHAAANMGVAGLAFNKRIQSIAEFVELIKTKNYMMIQNGKLVKP